MGAKTKCDPGSILKPLVLPGVTIVCFVKAKTFWTIDGSFKISGDFPETCNFMTKVFFGRPRELTRFLYINFFLFIFFIF